MIAPCIFPLSPIATVGLVGHDPIVHTLSRDTVTYKEGGSIITSYLVIAYRVG